MSVEAPNHAGDGSRDAGRARIVLYGIEGASTTIRAQRNLEAALEAIGVDLGFLQFVDVLENPQSAYANGVMATPMLVIGTGRSSQRVVGTLDNTEYIRRFLEGRQAR